MVCPDAGIVVVGDWLVLGPVVLGLLSMETTGKHPFGAVRLSRHKPTLCDTKDLPLNVMKLDMGMGIPPWYHREAMSILSPHVGAKNVQSRRET